MNKKGFTLVELLAVIIILGVILLIAVPKILDTIAASRLQAFNLNSDILKSSTEKYLYTEDISVPLNTTVNYKYTDIKAAGYITQIVDPKDNEECIYSSINVTNNNGNYQYEPILVCSNYVNLDYYNKILNYDFDEGTTDWSGVDANIAAASNILTNTGNGAYNLPVTSQYSDLTAVSGHKVYVFARARITTSDLVQMTFILSSSSWNWDEIAYNYSSNQNHWYNISAITTIDGDYSGKIRLLISHGYADSATANGKIMEINGNVGVYMLDLTEIYGSGNEPTKTEMDTIIDNMT